MNGKWNLLTKENQISEILNLSNLAPIFIFKHSTTCGISAQAKENLEIGWKNLENSCHFYYLDLLKYRGISNDVAEKLGVHHQSPQLILIQEGNVVFTTSHHKIKSGTLNENLLKLN